MRLLLALLFCCVLAPLTVSAQTPIGSGFDHFSTGWPLEGMHRNVDCGRCHVGAVFQGTSRSCASCHSQAGLVKSTPMAPDHVRVTNQCGSCHLETTWEPVWRVDHVEVQGSCDSCHNGTTASGKKSSAYFE